VEAAADDAEGGEADDDLDEAEAADEASESGEPKAEESVDDEWGG
jgi:hypothetical protein